MDATHYLTTCLDAIQGFASVSRKGSQGAQGGGKDCQRFQIADAHV